MTDFLFIFILLFFKYMILKFIKRSIYKGEELLLIIIFRNQFLKIYGLILIKIIKFKYYNCG